MTSTAAVRSTDEDAAISRLSCANIGYLEDAFASAFVKKPTRRPPLINIGTHARIWSIDRLFSSFLSSSDRPKQVLSLGSGSDTRFFRFKRAHPELCSPEKLRSYVEIDLAETTSRKAKVLKQDSRFRDVLQTCRIDLGGTALHDQQYHLLPGDLNKFDEDCLPTLLNSANALLDVELDTFVILECVLIYIDPAIGLNLLQKCCQTFSRCVLVTYDPINFQDAFGRMMISNLRTRAIELPAAAVHVSVNSQLERLRSAGFTHAHSETVQDIRNGSIPVTELARIAALELLDEVEELNLVLAHYAVSWATNNSDLELDQ